jgi:hypothetical protein
MLLYLTIFAIVALLALSAVMMNKPRALTVVEGLAIAALFWILSFSRWENGTDWEPYLYVYSSMALHGTIRDAFSGFMSMEPGYLMTNLALGWANSYHLFLCVIGLIVIGLKAVRIVDLSPCATYSFLIYLASLLGDIFFVRQSIAISICFFSLGFLIRRQHKVFILFVLIAATFHYSALLFLMAIFFAKERRRTPLSAALVFAISITISLLLFNRLASTAGYIFAPLQYLSDRLGYLTDNETIGALSSTSRNAVRLIEKILVYFFFAYRLPFVDTRYRRNYTVLLNLYYVSVLMTCLFSLEAIAMLRFSLYFSATEIILFPIAILSYSGIRRQAIAMLWTGYAFLRFWVLLQPYYDLYVPYRFFSQRL